MNKTIVFFLLAGLILVGSAAMATTLDVSKVAKDSTQTVQNYIDTPITEKNIGSAVKANTLEITDSGLRFEFTYKGFESIAESADYKFTDKEAVAAVDIKVYNECRVDRGTKTDCITATKQALIDNAVLTQQIALRRMEEAREAKEKELAEVDYWTNDSIELADFTVSDNDLVIPE